MLLGEGWVDVECGLGKCIEIQLLYLCPGPWGAAQECEARGDAWVCLEALDVHVLRNLLPAQRLHQFREDHFKCLAVKRVCVGVIHMSVHLITLTTFWYSAEYENDDI